MTMRNWQTERQRPPSDASSVEIARGKLRIPTDLPLTSARPEPSGYAVGSVAPSCRPRTRSTITRSSATSCGTISIWATCRAGRSSSWRRSPTVSASAGRPSAAPSSSSRATASFAAPMAAASSSAAAAGRSRRSGCNLHALPLEISERLGGGVKRATWEGIYDEVEAKVLACSPFGTFQISEAALGEHFRVSRTVIRDVLNRMHGRNLIGKDRRSHWTAGPLSARLLDENHEIRRALEPRALATALPALDLAALAAMRESVREAIATRGTRRSDDDRRPRGGPPRRCIERLRNRRLVEAVRQVQVSLAINRLFGVYIGFHDESGMLLEHRLVFDHMILGDATGAAAALEHHLDADHARARARLKVLSMFGEPEIAPYLTRIH